MLRDVLRWQKREPAGLTFAVQGYGSAGGRLAVVLQEHGMRLVAAADTTGGWHDPRGLDAASLWAHKEKGGGLRDFPAPGAARVGPRDVLTVPADIVVPAATANEIDEDVASALACRLVLEISNGPIAADAESIVASKGIVIVPDVVANAGGITMSHFEWVQNRTGLPWTEEDAGSRLEARMVGTTTALIRAADQRRLPLEVAAQVLAVERLAAVFGA